jgi:hypothetical protein
MEHAKLCINVFSRYVVLLRKKLVRWLALVTIDVGLLCRLYDVV